MADIKNRELNLEGQLERNIQVDINPLVSVILPSYNHKQYIAKAIQSVKEQTYSNIELIIIDDGSSDGTTGLVYELIQGFPWPVEFIIQTNKGAHNSINLGIRKSKGKYISILNSDDYYHRNRLVNVIYRLLENHVELAFSKVSCINDHDECIDETNKTALEFNKRQNSIREFPSVGFSFLDFNMAISSGNLVFTRSLFEKTGGFHDFKNCHDWDFVLRSLIFSEPLFINEILYFYRFHDKNTFLKNNHISHFEVRELMKDFFHKESPYETQNKLFPNKENWPEYFDDFIMKRQMISYLPAKSFTDFLRNNYRRFLFYCKNNLHG